MKSFIQKIGVDAYFVVMVLIAISLPFSKFTLSVFQFALLIIWICDGVDWKLKKSLPVSNDRSFAIFYGFHTGFLLLRRNFVKKFTDFLKNPVAVAMASLYLLHVAGLLTTNNFDYAMKDLRVKLPLLFFPVVMSTMPRFTAIKTRILLGFFVAAVLTGTMISLWAYLQKDFKDIREISLFISSVRFSLMVAFVFFILWFELLEPKRWGVRTKFILFLLTIWLVMYLILLESVIGLVGIVIISGVLLMREALKNQKIIIKVLAVSLFTVMISALGWYTYSAVEELTYRPKLDISKLDKYSRLGNAYRHDTLNFGVEDGRYVGIYFTEKELSEAWNKRSSYDFYGKDEAGQLIMYTVIRYLTSADLRKDADGVAALSAEDIRFIEKGIANKRYVDSPGLKNRISKIITGYEQFTGLNNPNGSSVMQRVEHIKASMFLIKENFWIGVGTGDMPDSFQSAYNKIQSRLNPEVRWRSHNQYLSMFIAFGFFGFLWFLFALLFPGFKSGRVSESLYLVFLLLMMLSMLSEDTIETQIGVSLFAFFLNFLLFQPDAAKSKNEV